ncbi:MAG: helix-turn-helix transcriptional regulator [Gudongella sp.]|jgi:transcriptional regulator with XRE-family HTH domain|nr:helix-turn-helix transcriptional regulator [Gudongella sp.]
MSIGEKIQHLRKTNNLSQEQLAGKLSVSRQAISKWELGESTPDTDKVILLSRIFQVSTDYLLLDDINSDVKISAVDTDSKLINRQYSLKALYTITTGIIIIGLFMSIIAHLTWQYIPLVSVGFIIQMISVVVFEAMSSRYLIGNENKQVRKRFYALNLWFILPFPIFLISDRFFYLFPRPRVSGIDFTIAIIYLIICGITTYVLKKNTENR